MLSQPLLDRLATLGLSGFRAALQTQSQNPQYAELTFEERLGLLVDVERTRRADNRLQRRVRAAHVALAASLEDLDLSSRRGLDCPRILELAQGDTEPGADES